MACLRASKLTLAADGGRGCEPGDPPSCESGSLPSDENALLDGNHGSSDLTISLVVDLLYGISKEFLEIVVESVLPA